MSPTNLISPMEVIEPQSKHTHTIINLHGRDSNASDYRAEFFESEDSSAQTLLTSFPTVKWVFPNAPQLESKRFGIEMSQWFDIWSTENPHERSEEQTPYLRYSIAAIAQLVREEASKVTGGMEHVILCGISQGAATALATLLEMDSPLCAFVGFSTWWPDLADGLALKQVRKIPVFLAHCQDDDVIDIKNGEALAKRLEEVLAMPVEWHEYTEGGHWINEPHSVDDVVQFLRRVMSSNSGDVRHGKV